MTQLGGWVQVKDENELREKYKFPFLPLEKFEQLYEVCSIHAAKKGLSGLSYSRREEVEEEMSDIESFEEYSQLIRQPLEDLQIYARRVRVRPAGYLHLEVTNILPKWPGKMFSYFYFFSIEIYSA